MAYIKKIKEGTETIYPATIPQAVVDPTSGKTVREELDEKADQTELDQLAGEAFDLFSIIGSYISKKSGAVVTSGSRKRTDYLPISLMNDLIVTGYDGSDHEIDGVALLYFYDRQLNPLGRFDSGQYGRVNRVVITKEFISTNYPTAAYVIASASSTQDDSIIIGITPDAIKRDYDAFIGDIELKSLLLDNNTIGLRQEVSFNAISGLPTVITYYNNLNQMVRQDVITYTDTLITEVRTVTMVSPNVSITIETNLETFKTDVTWN